MNVEIETQNIALRLGITDKQKIQLLKQEIASLVSRTEKEQNKDSKSWGERYMELN